MSQNQASVVVPVVPWAREPVRARAEWPGPAGVGRRGLAVLIDAVVVWLLVKVGGLGVAALDERELLGQAFAWSWLLVAPAAYVTLSHGTGGQTLGKRLVGARVVSRAGEPIGYPRALARYLGWWLALLPLGMGLWMAAFRRDRRGLHDLLAGTRVVRAGRSAAGGALL
jgi:uncharacterized RDD family membrane protein YckC